MSILLKKTAMPFIRQTAMAVLTVAVAGVVLMTAACGDSRTPEEQQAMQRAQLREKLLTVSSDPARAGQIQTLFDEWLQRTDDRQRMHADYLRRLDALNADYAAPIAAFQTLYQERFTKEQQYLQEALTFRDRLIATTTPDEWKRLTAIRADLRTGNQP